MKLLIQTVEAKKDRYGAVQRTSLGNVKYKVRCQDDPTNYVAYGDWIEYWQGRVLETNITPKQLRIGDKTINYAIIEEPEAPRRTVAAPQPPAVVEVPRGAPEALREPPALPRDPNDVFEKKDLRIAKESVFASLCNLYSGKTVDIRDLMAQAESVFQWVYGMEFSLPEDETEDDPEDEPDPPF